MDEPSRTFGKNNKDKKKESKGETKKNLWKKVKEETFKNNKKKMVDPYIPQKQDERLWIPVSGFLPIKPPTRRAMSEGTKGVLRFMDEYKSHAGVQQECCFGLITLAQRTEEALIFKERLVKCQTIQNILDHSRYKGKKIDFLNIDVEGAEMKVLKTLRFEIYDPGIICIEILGYRDLDSNEREIKIKNDEIYEYLISKNYRKVWSGSSYCSHLFIKD